MSVLTESETLTVSLSDSPQTSELLNFPFWGRILISPTTPATSCFDVISAPFLYVTQSGFNVHNVFLAKFN